MTVSRVRTSTWVEHIRKEPVRWAVPDYIARRVVSSVYAPRNAGKTMFGIWLAASAASATVPVRVWYNSKEDDLPSILKPRFDAAGISAQQIRLTDERWRLPADIGKIRSGLEEHRAGGAPDDVLILDSIQQHIVRPYAFAPSQETIKGLLELAIEFDIAVVLIGHTTRGKHGSVEAMISGSHVLQNLSKAIFVFGPEPGSKAREEAREMEGGETGNPRYVLACERIGIAEKPVSILFELRTEYDDVTKRNEPYLVKLGSSRFTAREVLDAAKTDDRGDRDAGKSASAAAWIVEALTANGPMPVKGPGGLEEKAQADGVFASRNTFERARKIVRDDVGLETGQRRGVSWVWLSSQEPPPK
jgi:AAA domain